MSDASGSGFYGFLKVILRGLNLTRIVILNLVFFLILGLIFFGAASETTVQVPADSTLVLEPRGALVEQFSADPVQRAIAGLTGNAPRQVQLRDLLRGIDAAAADPRIKGILLKPDGLSAGGYAALREVGAALDRFKAADKQVIVWSAGMSQGQYYLAAHADRIVLDPQGGVILLGIGNYRNYYANLLDKIGVEVHLFRVGEYKSAAEPFVLDHASAEAKAADAYWMSGIWDTAIAEIAAQRGLDAGQMHSDIAQLPAAVEAARGDLAQLALDQGLVDELATENELLASLHENVSTGESADEPDGGSDNGGPDNASGNNELVTVAFGDYLGGLRAPTLPGKDAVAVVVAEGEIAAGKLAPGKIGGESTAALIERAREDDNIKALVLRINSPGGAVYPSERIRREVVLTQEAGKPVIVSMGDVAASGGYWIGMNADKILAEPNTITGSIGIFGMFFEIPGALDKLGVNTDGVGTTPWAGAFDIRQPLDPRVGAVIQSVINKGYRDFVGRVAKARESSFEAIDKVARGRVWTGTQALERGLVDQLGGLTDAITVASEAAGLGDNYAVTYMERPLGAFEQFLLGLGGGRTASIVQAFGVQMPTWWAAVPKLVPELSLLHNAKPGVPAVYAYCFCQLR